MPELRALLQGGDDDDEDGDDEEEQVDDNVKSAGGKGGAAGVSAMMVFQADEEKQPAYEPPPKKEVTVDKIETFGREEHTGLVTNTKIQQYSTYLSAEFFREKHVCVWGGGAKNITPVIHLYLPAWPTVTTSQP